MNQESKYILINIQPRLNKMNKKHLFIIKFIIYFFLIMFFIFIFLKVNEFGRILKKEKQKNVECNCTNYTNNIEYIYNNYSSFNSGIEQLDYKIDFDNNSENSEFINYKQKLLEEFSKIKKINVTKINTLILINYLF